MAKVHNTFDFIKKAKEIHGDKYDYSFVEYVTAHTKVKIVCPTHGIIEQTPTNHLSGFGCYKCRYVSASVKQRLTIDEFVIRANLTHRSKYDYSDVTYINFQSKIAVICPLHGKFMQRPREHLAGNGCQMCGRNHRPSFFQFVDNANSVHGGRYNYSQAIYKNSQTKLTIVCPNHGSFRQKPSHHLQGVGCPKCNRSVSKISQKWLDSLGLPNDSEHREVLLKVKGIGRSLVADGFDPKTNTVYEFLGDWWHGNPNRYPQDNIHPVTKLSMGEMYRKAMERENKLRRAGYTVVIIWESDWLSIDSRDDKTQSRLREPSAGRLYRGG